MSKEKDSLQGEKVDSSLQLQLNEIYYNCTECSSSIEILSINENESNIEFKCIKNNHQRKMSIKDYIDKMKDYNDNEINNDNCHLHNNKYESYCLDCNIHLCKKCLQSRDHVNHTKNNIIEIQPNKKEIDIIQNIIQYYEEKIENLEKEKLEKTSEINDFFKSNKIKINEKKEFEKKEINNNLKKELSNNLNQFSQDIKNIKKEYVKKLKLRKYEYKRNITQINKQYSIKSESVDIIFKNKIDIL